MEFIRKNKRTLLLFALLAAVVTALLIGFRRPIGAEIQAANALTVTDSMTPAEMGRQQEKNTGIALGLLSLLPPLVAIVMAFITKEVVSSLLVGMLTGYTELYLSRGAPEGALRGILTVTDGAVRGLIDVLADPYNASVIVLCFVIGGLVMVIGQSGGFSALAARIIGRIKSPRMAQVAAQTMGSLIFFDDYANALIVGPVMRPITDQRGVSREKLAYIVDSTAAPIAGIAIISSWISAELSAIETGFLTANVTDSAYRVFLHSIPYCFYNVFALSFLSLGVLLRREYGPMLHAEIRARNGEPLRKRSVLTKPQTAAEQASQALPKNERYTVWTAILPIAALCVTALVGFYFDGRMRAVQQGLIAWDAEISLSLLLTTFGAADTITILLKAALLSSVIAVLLGAAAKAFDFVRGIESWLAGASELLVTGVILVLAWSLSGVIGQLGTAYYLVELLSKSLPYWLLPMLVFLSCCLISFAAGSYGCMLIVMPMAIPVVYGIRDAVPGAVPDSLVYACVAAVLSGSIFGDHCSPITDTTILSSIGAGCDNLDHVKTQLPYALTVAGVAAVVGMLPAGLGISPLVSVPVGLAVLGGILLLFGKDPDKTTKII